MAEVWAPLRSERDSPYFYHGLLETIDDPAMVVES